jgi:hypothetical protein
VTTFAFVANRQRDELPLNAMRGSQASITVLRTNWPLP